MDDAPQVLLVNNCANCLFVKESAGKLYCGLNLQVTPNVGWDGRPPPAKCPLRYVSVTVKLIQEEE